MLSPPEAGALLQHASCLAEGLVPPALAVV